MTSQEQNLSPWFSDGADAGTIDRWADDEVLPSATELSPERAKLARMVALSEKGVTEIAAELGVTRQTVWRWTQQPAVKARIREINEALDTEAYASGLARKRNRIEARARMALHLEHKIYGSSRVPVHLVREWANLLNDIARELGQFAGKDDVAGDAVVEVGPVPIREVRIFLSEHLDDPGIIDVEHRPVAALP
jgi:transposase-like protein